MNLGDQIRNLPLLLSLYLVCLFAYILVKPRPPHRGPVARRVVQAQSFPLDN